MNVCKKIVIGCGFGALLLEAMAPGLASAAEADAARPSQQSSQQQVWACPMMHDQHTMQRGSHHRWLSSLPQTTVDGRIEDVNMIESCMGDKSALHLKVKSGDQEYNVHVAPTRYVNSHNFRFALGDDLRVTGALVEEGDLKTIVAFSLEKGGKRLEIRDSTGRPFWAPGQRGRGMGPHPGLAH